MNNENSQESKKAKDFKYEKFELEINGKEYIFELDNESVKIAGDLYPLPSLTGLGVMALLSALIHIFSLKHDKYISTNLCKKIANELVDGKEYDFDDIASVLLNEYIRGIDNVFTSKGAKKTLKKLA